MASNSDSGGVAEDGSISGVAEDGRCDWEYEEEFVNNGRGMKLFTCRWLPPKGQTVKGQVFLCHGYAVECSVTMRGTGTRLAQAGYAVYGVDYEGHGKSEGLQGYIPSFDVLVADSDAFFTAVVASTANTDLPRFLLGESMGGAVALLLHRARPTYWTGAILVAPMCKIAEDIRPHPVVVSFLKVMTNIIPTWKIVPTADIIDAAYRMQEKRDEIRNNMYCYKGNPRLKTAYELLRVSLNLENNVLAKVSLPFLIVHGGDDKVTDPAVSDLLFKSAASQDKKLNLYPGMWHALTSGETPENIHIVFQDIIAWLDERSSSTKSSAGEAVDSSTASSAGEAVDMSSEMEQKAKHDEQHDSSTKSSAGEAVDMSSEMEQKAKHDEQHDSSMKSSVGEAVGMSSEMEQKAKHDEQHDSSTKSSAGEAVDMSSEMKQKAKHDEQHDSSTKSSAGEAVDMSSEMEQKAKHDKQHDSCTKSSTEEAVDMSLEMEQKADHDEQHIDKL